MISVVIPTLNEEKNIADAINSVKKHGKCEIIVSDGESRDNTVKIAKKLGVKIVSSQKGRAGQMNAGAKKAKGDIILFLHADTLLPQNAFEEISKIKNTDFVAGGFCIRFKERHPLLSIIAARSNYRILTSKVIFGDQAIFVKKQAFSELGGFNNIRIMEDVDFSKRLIEKYSKKRIKIIRSKASTSGRRLLKKGITKMYFKMGLIRLLYFLGTKPDKLARLYL